MTTRAVGARSAPLITRSAEETGALAASIARAVPPGTIVYLRGDLGAGKTAFARAFGEALGVRGVKSPTFAIESVHAIPGADHSLVHADLYRLDGADGVADSLEEHADDGDIVLVEWPDRWQGAPVDGTLDIEIEIKGETERVVRISARGSELVQCAALAIGAMVEEECE